MVDLESSSSTRDLPNRRETTLKNNTLVVQKDPLYHGLWRIHFNKGQVPAKLSGAYTSFKLAQEAAEHYLSQKKRLPTEE